MRGAAPIDGVDPTAHVPGIIAAATAATNGLSGVRHGRSREVRAAHEKSRVCIRVATCTPVARRDGTAPAGACPGLAPGSPATHPALFAALAQIIGPSQRRAETAGRRAHRWL